ncbi:hypothetical protein Atai01_71700 [Amycolatopsis taiwanensis]|uniref:ATPase n=1 Tax=Amycolatopsis taiwanensis TaxID=342230 RepID=A0A9W6VLI3_9PSEU|nr:hypothetical protein Atai01_71700 [Amycolatopsis taiwanensis]
MGTVTVIGDATAIQGWALAGAAVRAAEEPAAVRDAWAGLDDTVDLVILTPEAARVLGPALVERKRGLVAVIPP